MLSDHELRQQACNALRGKWATPVITTLVYTLLAMLVNGTMSAPFIFMEGTEAVQALRSGSVNLLSAIILIPLQWSFTIIFLHYLRDGKEIEFSDLFLGYKDFLRIAGTLLLKTVYIFLWTLCLFIPGIIKSYSYGMTEYLLRDEPELGFNAAIEKSIRMMEGHKGELFALDLSFIGWYLLGALTAGIGLLWVIPYHQTARAAFYENLKQEAVRQQ